MTLPRVIQGTNATADGRELRYWTKCEHCPERKGCRHDCDHPGRIRFLWNGKRSVLWQGIITQKKIDATVKAYLETDPPEDVARPAVQGVLL